MKGKEKKQRTGLNSFVVISFVIAIMAILTWFIPGGEYELDEAGYAIAGTYSPLPSTAQGIWDVISAPIVGMVGGKGVSGAISISLYILLFGSFLRMMDEAGVISNALGGIARKFSTRSYVLIFILTFVLSFL